MRSRFLKRVREEEFDIAVIGGGITGAGVARDAAGRGLRVALVEAGDFAEGTSSRSSKLIHGGIRYLEKLEFGLVFEALSERARLFEMAPHLVHPLRFLIPIYRTGRVPAWKMALGMMVYDALSLYEAPELHEHLTVDDVARHFPTLRTRDLTGGFAYSDAYMDDDRLAIETVRSAIRYGAVPVNHVRALGLTSGRQGGRILECEDRIKGDKFGLRARHVVSCAGPWTDRVCEALFRSRSRHLRPSKGVHITFARDRFPLEEAVVMAAEKRIVFAIPREEMVIVGTTDTDFAADPATVRAEPDDIRYLLDVVGDYFPGAGLKASDILACYAGVRPLIDDGAQTESGTSREHAIWTESGTVTFVAGGKYTTYRRMAEQVVKEVLRHFSIEERARFDRSRTFEPLNAMVSVSSLERARRECSDWSALPYKFAKRLADRHGMEAEAMIREARRRFPFHGDPETWMWKAEALHAVNETMCLSLRDFFFRRTPLVLSRRDHGEPYFRDVAEVMGDCLGWSRGRRDEEINAMQNHVREELAAIFSS